MRRLEICHGSYFPHPGKNRHLKAPEQAESRKGILLGWLKLSCLLSSCTFRPVSHTFLSSSFGVVSVGCHRPVTARFHAVHSKISFRFTVIHPSPLVGQGRPVHADSSVGRCMFLHLVRTARLLSEEHLLWMSKR